MSKLSSRKYHAKVLLFGEYTVIDGSAAVAVPWRKYYSEWSLANDAESKKGLALLKTHLAQLYYKGDINGIDFDGYERDYTKGLSFSSSIPTGYGLGSSGALTAGFFDRYFDKNKRYELPELKQLLGKIESCFHGNSSGLDPLVSYLNMPLLVHPDGDVEIMDDDKSHFLKDIRLIDTGIKRSTAPLVTAYKKTREQSADFLKDTQEIAEVTDQLIEAYILDETSDYEALYKKLSQLQLNVLGMLIPIKYAELWKEGLESDAYYMKLCGAGGGGCLLMHVVNEVDADKNFEGVTVRKLII